MRLYLLHNLGIGDQRKQRGAADNVADKNRDEVRDQRYDAEMSVQDKKKRLDAAGDDMRDPAAAIRYVMTTMT